MPGGVDLHSHTTASDGALSPRELVRLAARHGVRVLAITDHDSTEGLAEAMDEATHHELEIVPGLEINCDVPGSEIHVLGYCVDWHAGWFQTFLAEQRAERAARDRTGHGAGVLLRRIRIVRASRNARGHKQEIGRAHV